MQQDKNFGYLGSSFQQSLIKAIIEDKKFGEAIIDVLETKYFDNNSFKFIMENLKELYLKYNAIPDYETLTQKIMVESSPNNNRVHVDTLKIIRDDETEVSYVKDTALNFCKQQNIRKELKIVNNIIESGEFESYNKIEEIIIKALQVGTIGNEEEDVFNDIESVLEKDFRKPIPTGITGIDNLLKGGLGIGELGVVLAPTGVGKSTILTKFANTAYNLGYNVLQIFFEDTEKAIKRKHYTIWSGIAPDDQPDHREEVITLVEEAQNKTKSKMILMRIPSESVTISDIKNRVRKLEANGTKIHLLIIDYIDCISSDKNNTGEEWKGEGAVMRSLESMTSELGLVTWTATQGSRDSISSEVVTSDQMGGSIKKAQIAHVILSVGKTLEQKEQKTATMTLLKSRVGPDGVVFQNCKFDNEYLEINTDSQNTLLGMSNDKEADKAARAQQAYLKRMELVQKQESKTL